jgi:hypothetical protein
MNIQSKLNQLFSIIKSLAKSATFVPSLLVLVIFQSVFATTYYWGADGAGSGATGGTGTWDTNSLLWRDTTSTGTLSLWPNTDPNADIAQLAGTAGKITLNTSSVSINVNKIVFGTTGYTIAGPGRSMGSTLET